MSSLLALDVVALDELNTIERKKHEQKIKIVKLLHLKGPKSNPEISNWLKISSPTSMVLINELINEGLIEKQGRGTSVGGRKPDLFGLKENSLLVLSIGIDQFNMRMAIFNNNNNIISGVHTFPIQLSKDLSTLDYIYESASSIINSSGIDVEKLMGIGISMPGLVNCREGRNYTYLLTKPNSLSLQRLLEIKFKKPVFIQNDVNSATLAESRFGLAHGKTDVLVLSMDWGIGLGIIMDGKLRSGITGFAGEFGHIPFIDDGLLCHCGKRGCLDTVASGIALIRMAKKGILSGQSSFLNNLSEQEIDEIQPQTVIDAAHSGDQYAINILSEMGKNLGKSIAILIQLFNPELIILGGKIAEAKQYITVPIQHSLNTYCMSKISEKTSIAVSELGQNATMLGSLVTVMDTIFENHINW